MKTIYVAASIALILFIAASVGANNQNQSKAAIRTPAQPATSASGAAVCPIGVKSTAGCEAAPPRCGAFCQAGQQSPGWPYNWQSQYWLRPDTNY